MSSYSRSILVTGGTSGLGYECALDIARQRPKDLIVIASRTDSMSAASKINTALGQSNVRFLPLDLSSLARVRSFARQWDAPPIKTLVLNAGVQFPGVVGLTVDGIERTFAINHVGHALLFNLLRPHLAADARIVVVSSGTHDPAQKFGGYGAKYTTADQLAHPHADATKNGRQRYATSKLVNIMWIYALHRRLGETGMTATAFDPGLTPGTGLMRNASPVVRWLSLHVLPSILPLLRLLLDPNIHTPSESGKALARLAVGQDVEGVSGVYYEGMKQIKSSRESYDEDLQEELWEWTVRNTEE